MNTTDNSFSNISVHIAEMVVQEKISQDTNPESSDDSLPNSVPKIGGKDAKFPISHPCVSSSVSSEPGEFYKSAMKATAVTDLEVDSFLSYDDSTRSLFQRARHFLNPSSIYQSVMYMFAERKLIVFFGIHFVATMIVWGHFALIKYERQLNSVPLGANRYTWKLVLPPLEFGSMHAILFQMALIPLTMSRFSIAALNDSFLDAIIPLNRSLRMHIHLGYTMVGIVGLATIFFFAFFGMLCTDGEQQFCEIFTSEIMLTGYSILTSLLVIGGTSYFRHHIPYEIFYAIHHLVFIMYFITIAHTLDNDERSGKKVRSQTFKWFSSTLLFYFCDRMAMHCNHRYESRVVVSSTITGSNGSRMIILRMARPTLFQFKPGQYVFLQIKELDLHWHPFSIASDPESSRLEFYIEVFRDSSWTGKLWHLLEHQKKGGSTSKVTASVMGPYGTSLTKTDEYSHALALGAGTGIVPILSLLKQHVRRMLQYDPTAFFEDLATRNAKIERVELEREKQKGSLAHHLWKAKHSRSMEGPTHTRKEELRQSIRKRLTDITFSQSWKEIQKTRLLMEKEASAATRSLHGTVALSLTPVIGISVFALTISWNTVPLENGLFPGMVETLQIFTLLFQGVFFVVSLFVWDATTIFAYLDLVFCLVTPFADWYWHLAYRRRGALTGTEVILHGILTGYMTLRLWLSAVQPRHRSWKQHVRPRGGVAALDRLEVVWTARSASLVSNTLPDLLKVWNSLVDAWGYENAKKVCKISLHVTDPDLVACQQLHRELEGSFLEFSFERLDIPRWIEDHTIHRIENQSHSYSVLAFCGSPSLASEIHQHKISNDMLTAITGYKQHQMEFVSESYGGQKPSTKKASTVYSDADSQSLEKAEATYMAAERRALRDSLRSHRPMHLHANV